MTKYFNTPSADFGNFTPRAKDPDGTCFIAHINEIGLDILSYEEWYIDPTDGVEKALLPSGTVIMALFPVQMGLATGTVALVSRAYGAGDARRASSIASGS